MDRKISNDGMSERAVIMSPLDDPVVSAIFSDKESAGEAAASLVKALLEEDGESISIGKVISVTPQRQYNNPSQRGCRVDIEIDTVAKERIIVEVQIEPDAQIFRRNLFSAARIFSSTSERGSTIIEMGHTMPRVICINILHHSVRQDNNEVIQPAKVAFTKPPQRVAVDNFAVYSVQLPRIEEIEPDFGKPWYCWCYAMYHAHKKGKTLTEVVEMTNELQEFAIRDTGFAQYCELFDRVATDPGVVDGYLRWVETLMREQGMREAAQEIGYQEGLAGGLAEGHAEGAATTALHIAQNMRSLGIPVDTIVAATGLTREEIEKLSAAHATTDCV